MGLVLATLYQKKIVPILFDFHAMEIGAILTAVMEKKMKVRIDARTRQLDGCEFHRRRSPGRQTRKLDLS
jgi:hypothetical protein